MNYAPSMEIAYANVLREFEEEQHRLGLRPPLGTHWPNNKALEAMRSWAEIKKRRSQIVKMVGQGVPYSKIAKTLGIRIETVYNDVHVAKKSTRKPA